MKITAKLMAGLIAYGALAGVGLTGGAAWAAPSVTNGPAVDDSIIDAKIKSALLDEPTTKARQIKVKTSHGVVHLTGSVDTAEAKQRAEVIAATTEGVSRVRNDLRVRGAAGAAATSGAALDDSLLSTQVEAALLENPATRARGIKVSAQGGVVQLSGYVGSDDEKSAAGDVAGALSGVKRVENALEVKAP